MSAGEIGFLIGYVCGMLTGMSILYIYMKDKEKK